MNRQSKKKTSMGLNNIPGLLMRPFMSFFETSAKGGIVLILAAALALVMANSPLAHFYHSLWEVPFALSFAGHSVVLDMGHWINDGLMAIFFFLIGLEIKREVLSGELSSLSDAFLPVAAALGGMIVPAVIYTVINFGGPGQHGWGTPMATDIAFSLGILALLKGRVPTSLVIFLTALAIVDDLGAILVIALFYSGGIHFTALAVALGFIILSYAFNKIGVRITLPYVLIGICLWFLLLESGVHTTVAGVLLAMTIPSNRKIDFRAFAEKILHEVNSIRERGSLVSPENEQSAITAIESASHQAEAPLQHIEHHLHPWVTYAILPIFAFSNAGVALGGSGLYGLVSNPVPVGVILGLFFGKQAGIFAFSLLAVKSGFASLPKGTGWRQIYGVSILAGIGFTMSFFIASLAFRDDRALLEAAKTGILYASILSAVAGYLFLRFTSGKPAQTPE